MGLGLMRCTPPPQEQQDDHSTGPIFKSLSVEQSGVGFSNDLKEDSIINYFTYPYIYMGGGVATGDLNNDGFADLFLTGNMVENKLYLNQGIKGQPAFTDVTTTAGVGGDDRWVTGVTMADVNGDGWLDIYVSVSGKFATKKNLLYLNDGQLKDGVPHFTESAEERGIADEGSSTQGTFFDYDKDGDLDLYVANYPPASFKTPNYSYRYFIDKKDPEHSDKLYRNNGEGYFEDVTAEAGLISFGLSLSATAGDFNQDGWEDLYISNDFATPDWLYLNNGDGTFKETLQASTQHTAYFGMGTDVGDFNNDGLLDIVQMDMTPEDNRRNKANMASMNIPSFWEIVNLGMHYQYMQNALQLNNGITPDGLPHFSDIARLAGMSSTDWSWASLLADLDNDGWKDIFITNGTRRDINNKDYFNKIEKATYQEKQSFTKIGLSLNIPSEAVDNYVFKNNGDLTFEPVISEWGLSFEGFSNGAAYADFDNDGDLDLVINNIDAPAVVYQNQSSDQGLANYLRIKCEGETNNKFGLGTKVTIEHNGQMQYQELTMTRGFQSSVEPILHFGLGKAKTVDLVKVVWPDGRTQQWQDVPCNQLFTVQQSTATKTTTTVAAAPKSFIDITAELGINYRHQENNFDDYQHEILLPHRYSTNGPGLAVGDVNGDQREDFYIGAAAGSTGRLYVQDATGRFTEASTASFAGDKKHEDLGATFFDADQDGDLDLYIVSGGNEFKEGAPNLQDRFYLNDGRGNFSPTQNVLPEMMISGSKVRAADYDGDGDMDLFVGGRIVPRSYPTPAKSTILRNDFVESGKLSFTDVTSDLAPDLMEAGLVTDAIWADFNGDQRLDLIIVGEWIAPTFLENTTAGFVNQTEALGLAQSTGWWYSIHADDFDGDGDLDFVAGNLGLNYKYQADPDASFDVYANDYDRNGKLDIVLGYYNDGVQYPVRGRQCSSEQIPTIKYKFKDYNSFASASLEDIYTRQDLDNSIHYQAWTFASSYFENQGEDGFAIKQLPNQAQISSINSIISRDFNRDGHLDLLIAGNLFSSEVETPRNDASYGSLLQGDGKGNFTAVPYSKNGFFLKYDTKEMAMIQTPKGLVILSASNNDEMKATLFQEDPAAMQ